MEMGNGSMDKKDKERRREETEGEQNKEKQSARHHHHSLSLSHLHIHKQTLALPSSSRELLTLSPAHITQSVVLLLFFSLVRALSSGCTCRHTFTLTSKPPMVIIRNSAVPLPQVLPLPSFPPMAGAWVRSSFYCLSVFLTFLTTTLITLDIWPLFRTTKSYVVVRRPTCPMCLYLSMSSDIS